MIFMRYLLEVMRKSKLTEQFSRKKSTAWQSDGNREELTGRGLTKYVRQLEILLRIKFCDNCHIGFGLKKWLKELCTNIGSTLSSKSNA